MATQALPMPSPSTGNDLLDSTPDSAFEGNDTATDQVAGDTYVDEEPAEETFDTPEPVEEPAEDEPTEETPEEDAPAEDVAEEPAKEEKPKDAAEELPEGVVRGKDRNGKPGLFVEESRWKSIYPNHQLVQKGSELIGEPLTQEALTLRNDAYLAQERLFGDLTSGDPKAQGAVLNYFLDEISNARERGEVGTDAAVPLAQSFYQAIKAKSPDGYSQLRLQGARDLVAEMFQEAARNGDNDLFISTQHLVRALSGGDADPKKTRAIAERMGIPFYVQDEMDGLKRGADPTEKLRAENEQLRQQIQGKTGTTQAAQFDTWRAETAKTVKAAVMADAVKPALASVEDAWKQFPDDYQRLVVDPLHSEVSKILSSDGPFLQRVDQLNKQAQRPGLTAQRQGELRSQILQIHVNRAKLASDAVKPGILKFAANWLKDKSANTHARRAAAQTVTAPRGTSSAPRRSSQTGPQPGDVFDPMAATRMVMDLMR